MRYSENFQGLFSCQTQEIVSNPAAQKILKQKINTYKEKQRKAAEADGF